MNKTRECAEFAYFVDGYYMPFVKARKRSWGTDQSLINNHLKPYFFGKTVSDIWGTDLMMFQNQKLMEGYQPSSVNRMTVLLKYIVNCSMRWGFRARDRNWAEEVSELKNVQRRERFLSRSEAQALLIALDTHEDRIATSLIRLLLLTGARKSELLFARWGHIDWNFKTLTVPLSKSGSARHIFLGRVALQTFEELKPFVDTVFIFGRRGEGQPIKHLSRVWSEVRSKAGLQDVRLHDLRHSYASFLVANGRSLFEVQKLLGHASSKTTMKYAHLANKQLLEAADVLSQIV